MTEKLFFRYCLGIPHALLLAGAVWLAYALRFDFSIPPRERVMLQAAALAYPAIKLGALYLSRVYRRSWALVGIFDLIALGWALAVGSIIAGLWAYLRYGNAYPRSIYVLDFLMSLLLVGGFQFALRAYREFSARHFGSRQPLKPVLIYGAGAAGCALVKELTANPNLGYRVVGFLDDDSLKQSTSILGIKVAGRGRDARQVISTFRERGVDISEVVMAMPSATECETRRAFSICRAVGVVCKTVPGMRELLTGRLGAAQMEDAPVSSLLGRDPVCLDETAICDDLSGRSVLVTGGCGSIGSEFCRQIARFNPRRLVLFDRSENGLFLLGRNLRDSFPSADIVTEVGDIRDFDRLMEVMSLHEITSVFHAAAYKHVPMMENSIIEAVENNVLGTYKVALAAQRCNARKFLMISSDKAVNPSSIMGLTKRVAELIVSGMPLDRGPCGTVFTSVRFGNVLGSNGSVVPLFQQQIAAGGPVTVTHPDMRRYFMTIAEAVQLVLQASTMGNGGEVFVLDMGDPVKIVDLARNMIRLAGFVPDRDIEIKFSGMRPGEKLYEELALAGEDVAPTYHEKIKIFRGAKALEASFMAGWLVSLLPILERRNPSGLVEHMRLVVPEYLAMQSEAPIPYGGAVRSWSDGLSGGSGFAESALETARVM